MFWDNLVSIANKTKAKAPIHGNIYLNQYCLKEKRLLKMSITSQNNQAKKPKAITPQTKANPPAKKLKAFKKAKKKKKKNGSKKNKLEKILRKVALSLLPLYQKAIPFQL